MIKREHSRRRRGRSNGWRRAQTLAAAACAVLAPAAANAGGGNWTNATGDNAWSTGSNWSSGAAPGASDNAIFNLGSSAGYNVNVSYAALADTLAVNTDNPSFNVGAGQQLLLGGNLLIAPNSSDVGSMTLVGPGTVNVAGGASIGGSASGAGGTGILNVGNGNLNVDGTLGIYGGGTLNLDGGTLAAATLANAGGNFNWTSGTLKITGGTATVGNTLDVVAWGENSGGELGNGTTNSSNAPVAVTNLSSGVTAVAVGQLHGLAIQNGGVFAWGYNNYGELGDGTTNNSSTPVAVTGLSSGVTAIAAGDFHSLAVQNGGVYAWGDDVAGQLGNGTYKNSDTPVAVTGLSSGVTAVAAGAYHSLAIQNGCVYAWGNNSDGQLGNGTTSTTNPYGLDTPVAVTGLSSGVTAIAAGEDHSLAVQYGGVYAWGDNDYGQLGNGTTNNSNVPVAVSGLSSGVSAIATGEYHSLAVQNGSVFAWGDGEDGQLGDGTYSNSSTPVAVIGISGTIIAVAAGSESSYALAADGSLWDWGYNGYGALGLGTTTEYYDTPQHLLPPAGYAYASISSNPDGSTAVATLAPVAIGSILPANLTIDPAMALQVTGARQSLNVSGLLTLAGGAITTNALSISHGVSVGTFNWSSGTLNIVGSGTAFSGTFVVPPGGTLNLTGSMSTAALAVSGTVNISGGSLSAATITSGLGPGAGVMNVFAGNATITGALIASSGGSYNQTGGTVSVGNIRNNGGNFSWTGGTLNITGSSATVGATVASTAAGVAWGHNTNGEVGNGSPDSYITTPVAVINLSSGVIAVAAGTYDSLAVQNSGVFAWGDNTWGELGNGTYNASGTPIAVTNLSSGVTAIAAGLYHSLALQNGGVFAWGDNGAGELGNGKTVTSSPYGVPTPVAVTGLSSNVTAIAAGGLHSLAIQNGSAYAWGYNDYGELGNGSTNNSSTPVAVTGFSSGVTAIAAGYYHSLAVQNGAIYSWGDNNYGQLGNGTTNNSSVAVAVSGLPCGVTAIAAGSYFSLAVQNGGVYAWGANYDGQLGNGTFNESDTPVAVTGIAGTVIAVAAGFNSGYALAADGSIWDWGDNSYGELGLGSTGYFNTPQHLLPPAGYTYTSVSSNATGYTALATLVPANNSNLGTNLTINSSMALQATEPGHSIDVSAAGALVLAGGSITTNSLNVDGGTFNWSTGTLSSTAPITVGPGGVMNLLANTGAGIYQRNVGVLAIAANTGGGPNGQINVLAASDPSNRQLVIATGLSIAGAANAWLGKFDLANNDMDIQSGNLATITNEIAEGFNNGNWNGAGGIVSTSAAADTTHLTALGVIQNNQSGLALFTASHLFDGITPGASDFLIKYTYYGDANLDGKVDASDYSLIDNGYLNHLTGWYNGDFNYDGVVNGSDYTLIDNAFNMQGAVIEAGAANVTAQIADPVSAVPEPGSLTLVGAGAMCPLARRLRRRREKDSPTEGAGMRAKHQAMISGE